MSGPSSAASSPARWTSVCNSRVRTLTFIRRAMSRCWAPSCRSRSSSRRAAAAGVRDPLVCEGQLGLETVALEGEARAGGHRTEQRGLLQEGLVVDEGCHGSAVRLAGEGDRLVAPGGRGRVGEAAGRVHPLACSGQPVGDRQGSVLEHIGHHRTQLVGVGAPLQPGDQPLEGGRSVQPPEQETQGHRQRHGPEQRDQSPPPRGPRLPWRRTPPPPGSARSRPRAAEPACGG